LLGKKNKTKTHHKKTNNARSVQKKNTHHHRTI